MRALDRDLDRRLEELRRRDMEAMFRSQRPGNGDFDDMGCSREAGAYHYEQKRRKGEF